MKKRSLKTAFCLITLSVIALLLSSQNIYSQTNWFKAGTDSSKYKMGIDSNIRYDKQNAMTIKSIAGEIEGFGTLAQFSGVEKYKGKKIRLTVYMKSKDVANWAGFWLRVDQANSYDFLALDNMEDRPIKGTSDWKKCELVLNVAPDASNLAFGALIYGTGQIWFSNVNFAIVDNSVPTTGPLK